jgi:hypothetical protein
MKKTKYFTPELEKEELQVVIKPSDWPNPIRLTYSKPKGGVLTSIEELDGSDSIICSCTFRGRSANCSQNGEWLKEDKPFFNSFKAQDWILTDLFIEQYFKKH